MVTTRLPVESELMANEGEEKVIIKMNLAVVQYDEHSASSLITFTKPNNFALLLKVRPARSA
jgi:hypothetical protein